MRHARVYPVVIGLALTLLASTASASDHRRIGIVVNVSVNVTAEEARGIATELGEVLRQERPVDVIAGLETERRLPEGGLPDECVAKPACRNDLGRRLDADELLMLVIVKLGERIQIDATWANVASGKVTSRPQIAIDAGQDRADVFVKAVPLLLPHIKKEADKKGPDIVIVPQTQVQPAAGGRHFTTATWIATGVSAAALIGGSIFALSAQQKFSSLEDDGCRDMPCETSEIDSLRTRALTADVLFGVAAASAVTALWLYVRSDRGAPGSEAPANPAGIQVNAGPRSIGVSLGGRF